MSAPAVVVRFPLEGARVVYVDALAEGELRRLSEWLERHPNDGELVERAAQLDREAA